MNDLCRCYHQIKTFVMASKLSEKLCSGLPEKISQTDICTVKEIKKQKANTKKNNVHCLKFGLFIQLIWQPWLCFAGSGDYESLNHFVRHFVKDLRGARSQPDGDRQLFMFCNSTILWKKSKNVLRLNGVRRNEIIRKLCRLMMCPFDPSTLDARQSSMQSTGVYETLEGLQEGQLVNSEAIQALSETVTCITSVMSQFQTFMDKHDKVQNNEANGIW